MYILVMSDICSALGCCPPAAAVAGVDPSVEEDEGEANEGGSGSPSTGETPAANETGGVEDDVAVVDDDALEDEGGDAIPEEEEAPPPPPN